MSKKFIGTYVLWHRTPIPELHMKKWGEFLEKRENLRVAETTVGGLWVSTVFLGIDHNHSRVGDPVLFETMVFDTDRGKDKNGKRYGWDEYECLRYSTWAEALAGHEETVAKCRRAIYERKEENICGAGGPRGEECGACGPGKPRS